MYNYEKYIKYVLGTIYIKLFTLKKLPAFLLAVLKSKSSNYVARGPTKRNPSHFELGSAFLCYKLSKGLFTFNNLCVDFITLLPIYKKNEITQKLNLCSYREHQRYF